MHQEQTENRPEIISMEEYLSRRQKIRERERRRWESLYQDSSPASESR